jgi:hypothetical protein
MQDGFDLPSRLSSRKGASNPSDARQKKQRVPLHHRQRRKEACRRDPAPATGGRRRAKKEATVKKQPGCQQDKHSSSTRDQEPLKKRENNLATAPLSLPLAAMAGRQVREEQNKENPKQRRL